MNALANRACRDHVERGLEVLFGLAGKPDDEVGGDRGVRDGRPDPVDDAEIAFGAVRAAHRPQDPVRTGLQRHVQRRADIRRLGHRVDHVVGELGRMRRGEAHPLEAVDAPARAQQRRECAAITRDRGIGERDAVGVDVLAEQRDLEDALIDQRLHLGQDVAGPAVDLLAAQRRHDAERAGVVAADRDRNPCGVGGFARGRQRRREFLQRLDDFDLGGVVVAGAVEQRRQRADVVGAEHDVHPRRPAQHRVAVLLGQATADGDLHVRIGLLARRQVAEVAVQLVVGVLPDRAGVEHDDVGVGAVGGALGIRRPPAARPAARSRARSSGSRRCGPDRCAAVGEQRQPPSPPASPSKSRPYGTGGRIGRFDEFPAS